MDFLKKRKFVDFLTMTWVMSVSKCEGYKETFSSFRDLSYSSATHRPTGQNEQTPNVFCHCEGQGVVCIV